MWIARTADAKEKQDIINIQKKKKSDTEMTDLKKAAKPNHESKDSTTEESGVSLTLSEEAKKRSEANQGLSYQQVQEMLENVKQQKEGAEEAGKIWSRCMTIAIRIGAGDKVPLKDEKYLQEHEPKLYMSAMTMRMLKEDPKEYDSILEDEEEEQNNSGPAGASMDNSMSCDSSETTETTDSSSSIENLE